MRQHATHPLEVVDLKKHYGSVEAVKGVTFRLNRGEVFGLLGPNGAGKTSIISCVVTLEKPTSGKIFIDGMDVVRHAREAKVQVGHVPQEVINHGYFNVEEILDFHSGYYGLWNNHARIKDLMKRLRLDEHRHKRVKQLSGGMKRRLLIAKALVHSPPLLLLDEPTAGVDVELRTQLWDFVRYLKSEGVTVLLTTHYLEEAEVLCDRVAIIDQGEIRRTGATQELIRDLTYRQVRIKLKDEREAQVFTIPSQQGVGEFLHQKNLHMDRIEDISVVEGTLEEAFRRVIGR